MFITPILHLQNRVINSHFFKLFIKIAFFIILLFSFLALLFFSSNVIFYSFFLLAKRYVISLLFFFLRNFTLHVKILEEKKVAQSVCENTRRKKARDKILEEKKQIDRNKKRWIQFNRQSSCMWHSKFSVQVWVSSHFLFLPFFSSSILTRAERVLNYVALCEKKKRKK